MAITNRDSGTRIDEIADGIYRIHTPLPPSLFSGGFSFNQYLIVDDEPLLFHTGLRRMFPLVRAAIEAVMPASKLRHIAFSHVEADECGALNEFLAAAPAAAPLCGKLAAMVSIGDLADRPPRGLADGEIVPLGRHSVQWLDASHVPHGWECGFMFETRTRTLLCGDLLTQGGADRPPLTTADILESSEPFRLAMDYYAHAPHTGATLERLAATQPATLACMHGSAWQGDGGDMLRALASRLESGRPSKAA